MKNSRTIAVGFMLFAMFFGAGNLIYPASLGMGAGENYLPAIIGFILTGVGLPITAVIALSLSKNGATEIAGRVHPAFAIAFVSLIYLAIGPFFGIPRAANVAYEMGMAPLTGGLSSPILFVFSLIFFTIVFLISRNPSKLVDIIGRWLTPLLFLSIAALAAGALFLPSSGSVAPGEKYGTTPFFSGFVEGYLTMDAIAGLAFGIIVITSIQQQGVTDQKQLTRQTIKAGAVTAIGLSLVYAAIGWVGVKMAPSGDFASGSLLLSSAAETMFGSTGTIILGLLVTLACFTTCVGLTVTCGQYFSKRIPKLTYLQVITVVTILSLGITNLGLNQIIKYSVPVLTFLYPITIVLVILAFIGKYFRHSRYVYRGAVAFTAIISLYEGLQVLEISIEPLTAFVEMLPFVTIGLAWVLPAFAGGVLGAIIHVLMPSSSKRRREKYALSRSK
ncbi:branched-chain amino acid transport system II carrier protein [Salimicrobium salexigens]|uniref:Branched-chain amino acid transport system carrier protein n=1 Tax=Salimicrobium salexigens TaxID=908941 RepID=A0ABY1KY67_9BACI|nr:branched-chain amino acid transport system II carrier protein [Salimicrobium salexigens]SIS81061.1 branched-chain amino acid:cation transporter, LIVCS family [Salimicrobium salexigens]